MSVVSDQRVSCAVLLAAFNGILYVDKQVQSILEQVGVDITIFVSVDVSTDGTLEWFQQLSLSDPRIVLLPYGTRFGGASKNFFRLIRDVDFSTFDYVAFADQDDIWYSDKLQRATLALTKHQKHAYSSSVIAFWPNGKQVFVNKAQPQRRWDYMFESAGPGCTFVFDRTLMSAIKMRVTEDWDTLQRITSHDWYCYAYARAKGYRWYIDTVPSMRYRQHEHNQVGVNYGFKACYNRFKQIQDGSWLEQIRLITQLVGVDNSPFVKSWSTFGRIDFVRLAGASLHCRRSRATQVLVCFVFLFLAITPKRLRRH